MPTTTIRQLEGDELLEVLSRLNSYAFIASPPLDTESIAAHYGGRQGLTYFALFEGSTAVADAGSRALTQQVRGAVFPAGGIEGVATHPLARHKGYASQLLVRLLQADRQAGRVFSCLYPFRESFYERSGYVTFPLPLIARFEAAALASLAKRQLSAEQIEMRAIAEAYDLYRQYLCGRQQSVHGMALSEYRPSALDSVWILLARVDGELDGVMLYRLSGDTYKFTWRASRFYYWTAEGKYLLLSWIARHIDQAAQVELWLPPHEHPETWLADLHVKIESQPYAPMARVLDVARLGGMRTGPGSFVARVSDPLCPWNEGTWRFETVDGRLAVTAAERAECDLTIQGLTALVYGAHDVQDLAPRGWGDPSADLQDTMRTMFPPLVPYMHEFF
jgi:predicted acetyltransferase